MATLTSKLYSDLDIRFMPQPGNKDVSLSYNEQAVIRSVKNLLLTKPYEKLWNPTIGSHIDMLLFEPISPLTASLLQDEITRTIENWEPRARIATIDVVSYPDQNGYGVSLFLYIGNQTTPTALQLILKRSR